MSRIASLILLSALLVAPAAAQDQSPREKEGKPDPAKVNLSVASNPAEAMIYVRYIRATTQEKYLGVTPKGGGVLELKLDPGPAELLVVKQGYIHKIEALNLVAGGAARVEVRLTKDVTIPHNLNLKSSPAFVRSAVQTEELYVSVMAHVVRYFVEEKDPRALVESSVKSLVEVLNAVRDRELLLRRELPVDARRRYYGEELDLRRYPRLVFKRDKEGDKRAYTLAAGSVAVEGLTDGSVDSYLAMLWRVYTFVKKRYDTRGLLSHSTLARILIEGQLTALDDDHTHFLTPDELKEMNVETGGTFGGVGIVVSMRNGNLTVIAPMAGTPAQRAGLMSGDWIVAVDGHKTARLSMRQCVEKMRGKIDTPVELTIRRKDREFKVTILRAKIRIKHITHNMVTKKVGYLRISSFMHDRLSDEVGRSIAQLQQKGAEALVLDLRNNPGGLLPQAHKLCDLFVPKDKRIVSTRTRIAIEGRKLDSTERSKFKMPLVVLINEGSASASEILAGVLQEHKLATVIGTKSFGKGSVQRVLPLSPYECALALTVATYHLPSGATPHKKGITPDVVLELTEKQALTLLSRTNYTWDKDTVSADPQLKAAIKKLEKALGE